MDGLFEVLEQTWPAKEVVPTGDWVIRAGDGGGQRASAATTTCPKADIEVAERAMSALGQKPLFMVRPDQKELDLALEARGYSIKDPVNLYLRELDDWPECDREDIQSLTGWEPLGIMRDIWNQGGINDARIRVMTRASDPKIAILARCGQRPAGVAFVSIWKNTAMVHAVEVLESQRRRGLAGHMLWRAAKWAQNNGATRMSLAVTKANTPANKLYSGLGMSVVGAYHYRIGR